MNYRRSLPRKFASLREYIVHWHSYVVSKGRVAQEIVVIVCNTIVCEILLCYMIWRVAIDMAIEIVIVIVEIVVGNCGRL